MATRIKRYEAPAKDIDELLARIEVEMGSEAELETRHFHRGRFLGLFGGVPMVEVVAILDLGEGLTTQPESTREEPNNSGIADKEMLTVGDREETHSDAIADDQDVVMQNGLDLTADEPVTTTDESPTTTEVPAAAIADGETTVHQQIAPTQRSDIEVPSVVQRIKADAERFANEAPVTAQRETRTTTPPDAPRQQPEDAHGDDSGDAPWGARLPKAEPIAEPHGGVSGSEITALRESITDLKSTIEQFVTERADERRLEQAAPLMAMDAPQHTSSLDPSSLHHGVNLPTAQRNVYDRLLYWNILPTDAIELLNEALSVWEGDTVPSEEHLLKLIFTHICRNILLSDGIHLRSQPPGKVVALVGATGVGKTTTIAKLAAQFAFQQGKRVSLVSLDNYRIAAAEQLRTYSEIMGLDLDIVFSREEFDQVITTRRTSDLVLVDTAGRSPVNNKQIYELRDVFAAHPPDEVHLVISASTKSDDLRLQLQNFETLSYQHVILSKLDETRSLGSLYNLSKYCRYPISYFTVGQSVPEDVRTANLSFVRTWIEQGRIV